MNIIHIRAKCVTRPDNVEKNWCQTNTVEMRQYPWRIQRLVSTHQLAHKSIGGGGTHDQLKSKVTQSGQIYMGGGAYSRPTQIQCAKIYPNFHFGGGGIVETNSNSKCQDLPKFSFSGGEGGEWGYSRPTFLKYLSGGTQGILHQKFSKPSLLLHRR